MDNPNKPITLTSTVLSGEKRTERFRRRLGKLPWLHTVSFLFLTTVVAGFIWHNLRGAYRDTLVDRKSTRLNSSHIQKSRMPSSA